MPTYDVAIVGSRLAGGTLAMLLARKGLKVIAVDKATFPSNKVPCTHTVPAGAEATLKRVGLFNDFIKAGADPVKGVDFIYPEGRSYGEIRTNGVPTPGLQLRRIVMDDIVVQHARSAGAEVKESFIVRELIREGARIVGFRGETHLEHRRKLGLDWLLPLTGENQILGLSPRSQNTGRAIVFIITDILNHRSQLNRSSFAGTTTLTSFALDRSVKACFSRWWLRTCPSSTNSSAIWKTTTTNGLIQRIRYAKSSTIQNRSVEFGDAEISTTRIETRFAMDSCCWGTRAWTSTLSRPRARRGHLFPPRSWRTYSRNVSRPTTFLENP